MIKNTVANAKFKLSQHKSQGVDSTLSVFEVARLMDTVKVGETMTETNTSSVFFSMNQIYIQLY